MLDLATALPLIEDRWEHFTEMLQSLTSDQWEVPTRLPGWTVADLASHVSWGLAMEADAVYKMHDGVDTPAAAEPIDSTVTPAAMVEGIRDRAAHLIQGLRDVSPEDMAATAPMPYGPTPFPFVLQVFAMEASIHTDDLADAVGFVEELSPDAVTATMTVMGGSLPLLAQASTLPADNGAGFRLSGPGVDVAVARQDGAWVVGGPGEQTTTIGGDASALARFMMGRITADHGSLTVSGDGPPASSFKEYFPGP